MGWDRVVQGLGWRIGLGRDGIEWDGMGYVGMEFNIRDLFFGSRTLDVMSQKQIPKKKEKAPFLNIPKAGKNCVFKKTASSIPIPFLSIHDTTHKYNTFRQERKTIRYSETVG